MYFAHNRLSIIDLKKCSNQPFHSKCGRYSIIFNGEIYNYKELKSELKSFGVHFFTESDTEVLLNSLINWGCKCLPKLNGMFSFAFFDRKENKLILARDAFGIKPLFYSFFGKEFCFASEINALTCLRGTKIKPNLIRAYDYLVHGDYDSNNESFIHDINHLLPAHYLIFDLKNKRASAPICWWQPKITPDVKISFNDAAHKLRELFLESMKLHLRSDVPIGVALSGGIDSSSVAAAMRYLEPEKPIKTFSYVANSREISEEVWIDQLNTEIKALPHKVNVNQEQICKDLDSLVLKQGEPFGSTSIYAQYRIFKLAKESGVKVTLDGQGADELLGGYLGYPGHRLLSIAETDGWLAAHRYAKRWAQAPGRNYLLAWKDLGRLKLPDWLYVAARKKMGRDFQPKWLNVRYLREHGVLLKEKRAVISSQNRGKRVKEALANSLTSRGLPALLRHIDRNSMAFSIESRVPFLTLPLAEFLLTLPENYLVSNEGKTKHVFREAMRGIVPNRHLDRTDKIGFATPESTWIKNMSNLVEEWINQAPEIKFLKKKELLKEFNNIVHKKQIYDSRVWRWVNYLRWYSLTITNDK